MFLVVDESKIHRFNGPRVLIGSSRECDLTLDTNGISPTQCALTRESDGSWRVDNLSNLPILLNRRAITSDHSAKVGPSDHLKIGNHAIELRDTDGEGAVARALRRVGFSRLRDFGSRARWEREITGNTLRQNSIDCWMNST